jgi:hypothetical protein
VSSNQAKIQELFRDTLLSDEEIYWIGEPLRNYWHFKGRYLFYILALFSLIPLIIVSIAVLISGFGILQVLLPMLSFETVLILSFYILALFLSFLSRRAHEAQKPLETESILYQKKSYWWKPSYYAITNLRVLIFEQGSIRDYWYHLLDTPILKKPKNRVASIDLYSSTYAAKKKKTPVLDTLRGIAEEEADDAFALLKQAREEALENRAREMGIE